MKIALIGATGFVGSSILEELSGRNHEVLALARNPGKNKLSSGIKWEKADVNDTHQLAKLLSGVDLVVSAFNAGWGNPELYNDFIKGSKSIQQAIQEAGVKRLIVVGGAGSLFVAPGLQAVDIPDFPKEFHAGASAARDYLNELQHEKNIDWVFVSPGFEMHPGITTGRTGKYRTGKDNPVFNEAKRSMISVQDLAVAIADEVEKPVHHRERFTVAY